MAAAWGASGLQPSAEALKHFSLSLCFSQPKRTPAPVSARLTVTHADLSLCAFVCLCESKRKHEYDHCTYCFPCSQAAPGTSVMCVPMCVCVRVSGR